MAPKKKPAKMANRNIGLEAVKDDGEKYAVVGADGRPVYPGGGVGLHEAVRLGTSLVSAAGIARVEGDGTLTPGRIGSGGEFQSA
ncbi:MAG TPA: hypothetical protein VLA98_09210 [Solirubrobacteraceae bacterium]|nr:hypothetical protein [Solirubrobacteraceae bacterium]